MILQCLGCTPPMARSWRFCLTCIIYATGDLPQSGQRLGCLQSHHQRCCRQGMPAVPREPLSALQCMTANLEKLLSAGSSPRTHRFQKLPGSLAAQMPASCVAQLLLRIA